MTGAKMRNALARAPRVLTMGLILLIALPAYAADTLTASAGWVRAVPSVAKNSAGYLVIKNNGDVDDVLVGASVAKARVTEVHEMVRDGDAMSMRHRAEVTVPAHGSVTLAPGGLHLMLIDLQQPLQIGEKLAAVLRFRGAGEVKVEMEVRAP